MAKKVDKAARRNEILAAATEAFARHGYRQTTIEAIAEAAGVGKGSVYLYFGSKEDLFYALFEKLTHDSMAGAAAPAGAMPESAGERILALFRGALRMIDANPELIPLTLEFWSASGLQETRHRFGPRYAELFAEFRGLLAAMIQDGIDSGEFARGLPATELASCLMAMVDGLLLQQWTDSTLSAYATVDAALPVLLRSLQAPSGSSSDR